MTNLLPNLLPIATNTPIVGETEPNQTPNHAPNLEECGRYTLYARKPSSHCTGKLSNYFAFPFGQGRAAGFVRDETQSASVMLSWIRSALGMEDDVSQN